MKVYQAVVSYDEPTQSVIQIYAESKEEAINTIRYKFHEAGVDIVDFESIEEIVDIPDEVANDLDGNRTIN